MEYVKINYFVKKAIALGTKKIIVFDKDISIYKTSEKFSSLKI